MARDNLKRKFGKKNKNSSNLMENPDTRIKLIRENRASVVETSPLVLQDNDNEIIYRTIKTRQISLQNIKKSEINRQLFTVRPVGSS